MREPSFPRPTFLTAEWRHLAMINYAIDPGLLTPFVPAGTVLDEWGGTTYVSLVGFLFLDTRVLGLRVPGHRDFEEVNLRFYVRRPHPDGDRRGVVFIKELVPKPLIAWTARAAYNENYVTVPMAHCVLPPALGGRVEYSWQLGGRTHHLAVHPAGPMRALVPGSEMEFIAEHYWGYARQRDGGTVEYQVDHPAWRATPVQPPEVDLDAEMLYGPAFAAALSGPPLSAFLAEGSRVSVARGRRLPGLEA